MTSTRSNQQWLTELRDGDDAALGDLRTALQRGLAKALAGKSNVDTAAIEDFAQDGIVRLLDRLDSYRGDSRFLTWAHAVAINNALTELRRRRWRDVPIDEARPADEGVTPADSLEREEVLTVLRRALDEVLTEKQRKAMLLLLEDMPYAAIADRMGIKLNALYKLAHDARQKLRQAFHDAGFEDDDVRTRLSMASET